MHAAFSILKGAKVMHVRAGQQIWREIQRRLNISDIIQPLAKAPLLQSLFQ